MQINELINNGLRSQFLINLNSYSLKVLEVVHITKGTLEEKLQMFEQSISGMVHLVDFILTKSV